MRELFADEPSITPRFVLWLAGWLPDSGAVFAAEQGGPHHRGWTVDRHVHVTVMDLLKHANYQRGGGKGTKPQPTERPKNRVTRRTVTVAELNQRQE